MLLIANVVALLLGVLVSAGTLPTAIRVGRHLGAVDAPGGRRSHRGDIPRLGGIGIFSGFVVGVGAALLIAGRARSLGDPTSDFPWAGAGLGAAIIFVAGLLDDLRQFRPRTKFLLQFLAAGVAIAFGVRIDSVGVPFLDVIQLGAWSPIVTMAWLLVITNAMNLIDGLDGLAGGLGLIVTTTMAFIALGGEHYGIVMCAVGLAGALIGFLWYNFNPARIFMGDGGSQFLGFMLALISIRGSAKGATAVALSLPILLMGVPLLDLTTTVARRALRGPAEGSVGPNTILHRISRADREHLHHNLLDLGWSPRRAVLLLYLIASGFALAAYLSLTRSSLPVAGVLLILSIACVATIKLAPGVLRAQAPPGPSDGP